MQSLRQLFVIAAGLAAVAPKLIGATIEEDFSADPATRGWQPFGQTNLFAWDQTNQNLRVTWDSSKPNSYFYHPLGVTLKRQDNFSCSFDLRLASMGVGLNSNKTYAFEIALGFLNLQDAVGTTFLRGTGINATNLVEFDYFRDTGYGATVWPQFVSSDGAFNYNGMGDYTIYELTIGDLFHVEMNYNAANEVLSTKLLKNGAPAGPIHSVRLDPYFTDFEVDAFSISSYSDARDDYDSVLAEGTIDNIRIVVDPQAVGRIKMTFSPNAQAEFGSRTGWLYTLERSADLNSWAPASVSTPGTGARMTLSDTNAPLAPTFYRVHAQAQ